MQSFLFCKVHLEMVIIVMIHIKAIYKNVQIVVVVLNIKDLNWRLALVLRPAWPAPIPARNNTRFWPGLSFLLLFVLILEHGFSF